jgi:hypothetical protein
VVACSREELEGSGNKLSLVFLAHCEHENHQINVCLPIPCTHPLYKVHALLSWQDSTRYSSLLFPKEEERNKVTLRTGLIYIQEARK